MRLVISVGDRSFVLPVANYPTRRSSPTFAARILLAAFRDKPGVALQSLPVILFPFAISINLNASQADIPQTNSSLPTSILPVPAFVTFRSHHSFLRARKNITPAQSFVEIGRI